MGFDFTINDASTRESLCDPVIGENRRNTSYGGWGFAADFIVPAADDLVVTHPGAARLTPAHLVAFRAGLDRARAALAHEFDIETLEWLIAWTEYALEHFPNPTLHNE